LFIQEAFAASPIFRRQEVKDLSSDWINIESGRITRGPAYTDIQSVNFFSNGTQLNATLWLSSLEELSSIQGKPFAQEIFYVCFLTQTSTIPDFKG
jgi:hypothetical protein